MRPSSPVRRLLSILLPAALVGLTTGALGALAGAAAVQAVLNGVAAFAVAVPFLHRVLD